MKNDPPIIGNRALVINCNETSQKLSEKSQDQKKKSVSKEQSIKAEEEEPFNFSPERKAELEE